MAARYKACAVFDLSITGVVGSNSSWVMMQDLCLSIFCYELSVRWTVPRPRMLRNI